MRKHKFVPTGVQQIAWTRGYPETLVLYRCQCGCGKQHTETLRGTWTAEQLGFTGTWTETTANTAAVKS